MAVGGLRRRRPLARPRGTRPRGSVAHRFSSVGRVEYMIIAIIAPLRPRRPGNRDAHDGHANRGPTATLLDS
ncbi:hypothetical protein BN2537_15357 [Streptomyces venezuelae]|nr:hypothetical protein BN2537_15357 [Streptomyces venezuelae]